MTPACSRSWRLRAGQRLEEAADQDLAHALCLETEGNPFFVGEVLRSLMETGAIYQDDRGRWTAAGEMSEMVLPNSVREVISAHVGRLGPRADPVLSMAAVIGRDFDFDLLDAVTDLSQEELLDLLDAASSATLVREVPDVLGRYSFLAHVDAAHVVPGPAEGPANPGPSAGRRGHRGDRRTNAGGTGG